MPVTWVAHSLRLSKPNMAGRDRSTREPRWNSRDVEHAPSDVARRMIWDGGDTDIGNARRCCPMWKEGRSTRDASSFRKLARTGRREPIPAVRRRSDGSEEKTGARKGRDSTFAGAVLWSVSHCRHLDTCLDRSCCDVANRKSAAAEDSSARVVENQLRGDSRNF
ncbi:hypothetical protein BHE74_00044939 [Ensete ventricosum]|nr:hypothetical protein BHE74_00044939 [Ensete ventricosum]